MTVESVVAFNLALLAAMASPGPALLVLVRTALAGGRTAGIAAGVGLAIVASGWTGAALLGLDAVFTLVPWAYAAAKVAGALYLLWFAWKTWRHERDPIAASPRLTAHAFRDGILVNLLNPKSVLFAAAVLVVVFPATLTPAEKGLVVLNHLAVEIAVYTALACLLASPPVSRRYLSAKRWLDRCTAIVLGALGLRLLTSR